MGGGGNCWQVCLLSERLIPSNTRNQGRNLTVSGTHYLGIMQRSLCWGLTQSHQGQSPHQCSLLSPLLLLLPLASAQKIMSIIRKGWLQVLLSHFLNEGFETDPVQIRCQTGKTSKKSGEDNSAVESQAVRADRPRAHCYQGLLGCLASPLRDRD